MEFNTSGEIRIKKQKNTQTTKNKRLHNLGHAELCGQIFFSFFVFVVVCVCVCFFNVCVCVVFVFFGCCNYESSSKIDKFNTLGL